MNAAPLSAESDAVIHNFPVPGRLIGLAYRELGLAVSGSPEEKAAVGDPDSLARPWLMATVTDPEQRRELWGWLAEFVVWLTREYVFNPDDALPPCWFHHRPIVNELGVLVDQRYRAELALTSDHLEEWHRYALPSFLDRARHGIGGSCLSKHTPWPAAARLRAHLNQEVNRARNLMVGKDVECLVDALDSSRP